LYSYQIACSTPLLQNNLILHCQHVKQRI
jgi:hypothetical protein